MAKKRNSSNNNFGKIKSGNVFQSLKKDEGINKFSNFSNGKKKSSSNCEDDLRLINRVQSQGFVLDEDTASDGNCQFDAVARQLNILASKTEKSFSSSSVRKDAVNWINEHWDFSFKRNNVDDSSSGVTISEWTRAIYSKSVQEYCDYMRRNGVWGDEITLHALSEVYSIRICIFSSTKDEN